MGMGHDDPFNVFQLNPHLPNRLDLIVSFANETYVNEGKILGRGHADDVNMGIWGEFILARDEINAFGDLGHLGFLNLTDTGERVQKSFLYDLNLHLNPFKGIVPRIFGLTDNRICHFHPGSHFAKDRVFLVEGRSIGHTDEKL
jgi:hypothetical protein